MTVRAYATVPLAGPEPQTLWAVRVAPGLLLALLVAAVATVLGKLVPIVGGPVFGIVLGAIAAAKVIVLSLMASRVASSASPASVMLLAVVVTAASIQDRDGAHRLLVALRARCSTVSYIWADGGYAGRLLTWAKTVLSLTVEVVKRTDKIAGFVVLPRRWVVERTFGWITKHRRCVRDYETLPSHHEAMVHIAMIMTMSRRLAHTGNQ